MRARTGKAAVVATIGLGVFAGAGPALADGLLKKVSVAGDTVAGKTLSVRIQPELAPGSTVKYDWRRCASADRGKSSCVRTGTGATYALGRDDIGQMLRVKVETTLGDQSDEKWSDLTAKVRGAAGDPPPVVAEPQPKGKDKPKPETPTTPTTTPPVPPATTPTVPTPTTQKPPANDNNGGNGNSGNSGKDKPANNKPPADDKPGNDDKPADPPTTPTGNTPPPFSQIGNTPQPTTAPPPGVTPEAVRMRYLQPFPVVRIRGRISAHGARVSLFRVTGPRQARVQLDCVGRRCPMHHKVRRPGRVRALERYLAAGLRITVRVTRRGYIGKHVRLLIRAGKAPTRRDACTLPGGKRAAACPRV